jgi:SAM-dependent methyltransferase
MTLWTTGNAAKLYCLNWIADYAQQHSAPFTILDLGCGTAANFIELLETYPQISFVGIEPSASECKRARHNLRHANATIIEGYAYEAIKPKLPQAKYEIIVSFSVFEHVYRRLDYLQFIASCLTDDGYCLMNYDAGHFHSTHWKERLKTALAPLLARLGDESRYQAFVREADFERWATQANLTIIERKMFNTPLKGIFRAVPENHREEYMQRWLDLEEWLNTIGIQYRDSFSSSWVTRNILLQKSRS